MSNVTDLIKNRKKLQRIREDQNKMISHFNPVTQTAEMYLPEIEYTKEEWAVGVISANELYHVYHIKYGLILFSLYEFKLARLICRRLGENIHIHPQILNGDVLSVVFSPKWALQILKYDPELEASLSAFDDNDIPF